MTACGCTTYCLISMEHHCHSMEERKHRHVKRGIYKRGETEDKLKGEARQGLMLALPHPFRLRRTWCWAKELDREEAGVVRRGVATLYARAAAHPMPHAGASTQWTANLHCVKMGKFLLWQKFHIHLNFRGFISRYFPCGALAHICALALPAALRCVGSHRPVPSLTWCWADSMAPGHLVGVIYNLSLSTIPSALWKGKLRQSPTFIGIIVPVGTFQKSLGPGEITGVRAGCLSLFMACSRY